MKLRFALLAVCAISLFGCATAPRHTVSAATLMNSKFDTVKTAAGPIHTVHGGTNGRVLRYFVMSTTDKKTGAVSRGLSVRDTYNSSGWRFWSYASTDDAKRLKFVDAGRKVNGCDRSGCNYTETFSAMIDDETFSRGAATGIEIRLRSRSGVEEVVRLDAHDFSEVLRLEKM